MKRHESLIPLSREHHEGLILARLLQKSAPLYKGLPSDTAGKAKYATEHYQSVLKHHFLQEEEMLQMLGKYHPGIAALSKEITAEHRQLSAAFETIDETNSLVEHLHSLGTTLEAHIRKEERILFPLIEEHCPAEILNALQLDQKNQHEKGHQ